MLRERATITIACDRRNCISTDTVIDKSYNECNRQLFTIGWRACRDKQLCPKHAEMEMRRLDRRDKSNDIRPRRSETA